MVMSSLYIGIPADMVELVGTVGIGNSIKVKCELGYSRADACLYLMAQSIEIITKVKIVVN